MTKRLSVIVEADGGARGNPGPAGYGAVVREASTGEVLAERQGTLGVATNNVAEYSGLIHGLRAAAELGAVDVEARMDSKLVVEQMSGRWRIKHPGLRPLAAEAAALVRRFGSVRFTWVPRERNRRADALANAAMDGVEAPPEEPSPGRVVAVATDSAVAAAPDLLGDVIVDAAPAEPSAVVGRSWEPPTAPPTRLILVRHGATEFTAQRRYSGRGDVPLSERGVAQAQATARRLVSLGAAVAAAVSSPLARCVQTAEIVAGAVGVERVHTEPNLVECDFGLWEGLTFAEVRQRWPEEAAAWFGSTEVAPPRGESFVEVSTRVRAATQQILDRYAGQVVVVVTHVSPIKMILRDALAAGDGFLHRCYLDPAGLSIVDTWPDGGVAVRTVNDTAHLTGTG